MPSFLGCFCVRKHRSILSRKRGSRKKILYHTECNSDTNSEIYTKSEPQRKPNVFLPQKYTPLREKEQNSEMLSMFMDKQTPSRPHVQDIFPDVNSRHRQNVQDIFPDVKSPRRHATAASIESMYGYVPKAVSAMSASTALTGVKYDDFLSDRRMHIDLNKFAKSSEFGRHHYANMMYPFDFVDDDQYTVAPAHVHIEMTPDWACSDVMIGGSVSSSPLSTTDDSILAYAASHDSLYLEDNATSNRDTTTSHIDITANNQRIENMFQCDGDILY